MYKKIQKRKIEVSFVKVRGDSQIVEIIALMDSYQAQKQKKISLITFFKKIIMAWELAKPLRNRLTSA